MIYWRDGITVVPNKEKNVYNSAQACKETISNLPAVCIGETVDVEAATRGTEVGPLRGTFRNNR